MEKYSQPTLISEAVKTDPELRALVDKIGRGEISLCAPFEGMDQPWPEEKVEELNQVLRRFGWK